MSDPIKAGDFVCDADGRDLHPFKVGQVLSGPHGDVLVLMTTDGERSVGSAPIDKMIRLDVKDEIASDTAVDSDPREEAFWSAAFFAPMGRVDGNVADYAAFADAALVEWRKRWGAP